MLGRKRLKLWIPGAFLCVIMVGVFLAFVWESTAEWRFKKHVADPIPESVKDLKFASRFAFMFHFYAFRFSVSEEDMKLLLSKRAFKKATNVSIDQGTHLYWEGQGGWFSRTKNFLTLLGP